jgi:hypothetical protein
MNRLWDQLSDQLAELLNNGKVEPQSFADGGSVLDNDTAIYNEGNTVDNAINKTFNFNNSSTDYGTDNDSSSSGGGLLHDLLTPAAQSLKKQAEENYRTDFFHSPLYTTRQYQEMGKFFSPTEPGNFYTNRYAQPRKNQPVQSTKASDFYERWYERMRNFAQGEEVATRGQPQIRSTGNGRG